MAEELSFSWSVFLALAGRVAVDSFFFFYHLDFIPFHL